MGFSVTLSSFIQQMYVAALQEGTGSYVCFEFPAPNEIKHCQYRRTLPERTSRLYSRGNQQMELDDCHFYTRLYVFMTSLCVAT